MAINIGIKRIGVMMIMLIIAGCSSGNTITGNTALEMEDDMKQVIMETSKGRVVMELYTKDAPITTKNFIDLANAGFYNGLTFHRYEPGFVIQGGDPNGDGTGGSPNKIKLEINPKLTHVKGAVAMARTNVPDSASSQFYIALEDIHFLDGNYAVFGKVTEGMDNVLALRKGDTITSITVH
jgi:cyclophilin family peptidyl-prolyl cis-trans isomerase